MTQLIRLESNTRRNVAPGELSIRSRGIDGRPKKNGKRNIFGELSFCFHLGDHSLLCVKSMKGKSGGFMYILRGKIFLCNKL